ncbi:hypothetical protein M9H77_25571 [Catharanthus roseus]|uniref:Uncharacterized protein n=1 Tax=Catharanthus roseus TaxID=4058 RepID=A0ACC0A9V2_CATRO|nr:hypothetical protein M9H77_25571 [Catharanthus roseus]
MDQNGAIPRGHGWPLTQQEAAPALNERISSSEMAWGKVKGSAADAVSCNTGNWHRCCNKKIIPRNSQASAKATLPTREVSLLKEEVLFYLLFTGSGSSGKAEVKLNDNVLRGGALISLQYDPIKQVLFRHAKPRANMFFSFCSFVCSVFFSSNCAKHFDDVGKAIASEVIINTLCALIIHVLLSVCYT